MESAKTFVLVGGGTVGVELAGTIAEMAKMALAHDFRHLGPGAAQVMLYEGAPRILPSFAEDLSAKATRHLEELGVKVFTGTRVESVDAEGIVADGKRIRSRTVMWTAGVAASPAARWLGAEADKSGRVKVNPDLSVPGHAEIFAIGDTALVIANTRNLLGFKSGTAVQMPGLAQPAIQQGEYVAEVIRRRTTGKAGPEPFWYWDKGDLAVVGRTFAVADLRFWKSAGLMAWLLWAGVHIYFLIGFTNRLSSCCGGWCSLPPGGMEWGRWLRKRKLPARGWIRRDREKIGGLKSLRENWKTLHYLQSPRPFMARLKSCPDTKHEFQEACKTVPSSSVFLA